MRRPRVSILVPVFNEAPRLDRLFRSLGALGLGAEIVAVDDGSADASLAILRRWEARGRRTRGLHGLRVLVHRRNRGKGAAIRTALRAARGSTIVLLDADLECDPADIRGLLSAREQSPGSAIFGTRFPRPGRGRGVPAPVQPPRVPAPAGTRLANRLLTGATNLLFGTRLTDMACGFKALSAGRLRALGLRARRFELEAEITAGLVRRGIQIVEVPVRYRPRSYGEGKKIHPLDGVRILWKLLLLRLGGRNRRAGALRRRG